MISHAFVLASGARIAPFDDAPGDALIVNKPLREIQAEVLQKCGVRTVVPAASIGALPAPGPEHGGAYLVIGDDVFITPSLLRDFLVEAKAAATGNEIVRLAIPASRFLKDSAPLQDLVSGTSWAGYPVWVVASGGAPRAETLERAAPVVVDVREEIRSIEGVPKVFAADGKLSFALTSRVVIRLQHWIHILKANQLAMLAGLASLRERSKLRNALAIAWLLLRAFPPNEARVMKVLVQKGRKVKIHPSAVVEASILGDGVKIGAQAVVRGSVLGPGAIVGDFGLVENSVLGAEACVTKRGIANFSVLYPGAVLGHISQMGLLGRGAFVTTEAILIDMKAHETDEVTVEHRGKLLKSGMRFLGSCIGHGAFVGAGVYLRHGTAVPNGAQLVKDPSEIVREIPAAVDGEPDRPRSVQAGKATPLARR